MSKSVIFDMDGVLFNTESLCMRAWIAIADKMGYEHMNDVYRKCIGVNSTDGKNIFLDAYGKDFPYDEFIKEARKLIDEEIRANGMPVKEGVREILEYMKAKEYKIAIASSTAREGVIKNLELAGLREYFEIIISGDMVVHSKPDPQIYLMACDAIEEAPCDCIAIEDSMNGIRSAYAAGMKPIMVVDLLEPESDIVGKYVKKYYSLLELLEDLKSGSIDI